MTDGYRHVMEIPELVEELPKAPAMVRMAGGRVMIGSTGRPVDIQVPADITDAEAMEFAAFFLTGFLAQLRAETANGIVKPPPGFILPR